MLRSQALETLLNLLNLTQPCTKDSQSLLQDFLNPLNLTWLCTKASWNLLRNLLRNPVERDLALRQSLCAKASQPFSGTFSRTMLNLTWLCTKASQAFSGTFLGTLLNVT